VIARAVRRHRPDGWLRRALNGQRFPCITGATPAPHFTASTAPTTTASAATASLRAVEDYTNKYKGEQVELALFGGDYQEGTLTAYCSIEDVPHVELNGHILVPLQNVASLHCSSRCDAPQPDWPPRGLEELDREDDRPDDEDDES
jgi:hypothetical protein